MSMTNNEKQMSVTRNLIRHALLTRPEILEGVTMTETKTYPLERGDLGLVKNVLEVTVDGVEYDFDDLDATVHLDEDGKLAKVTFQERGT